MRRLSGTTKPTPPSSEKRPATCLVRALEHLDDGALGPPALVAPGHARRGAIAVHQHPHLAVRQEQVVTAVVRRQEAEAVLVALHPADHDRQAIDQAVLARAVEQQLPVARHRGEALRERLAQRRRVDAEPFRDRVRCQRHARFCQGPEQQLAARHRLGITRRFLAESRVLILPASLAAHGFF